MQVHQSSRKTNLEQLQTRSAHINHLYVNSLHNETFGHGLTATATGTAGSVTYVKNTIHTNPFTGAAAQATTLPAAKKGVKVIHNQSVDTTGGVNTLTFVCAGTDVFKTGNHLKSTSGAALTVVTSTLGQTTLTFTPANATTNILTIGSNLIFSCVHDGVWSVSQNLTGDPLAVTGTFGFS